MIMTRCCPRCAGSGVLPDEHAIAEIEAIAAALRASCAVAGAMVTGDGRVDEVTAAMLIGMKPKTLSNWRHSDRPIAFMKRHTRVLYSLVDLAAWIVDNGREA